MSAKYQDKPAIISWNRRCSRRRFFALSPFAWSIIAITLALCSVYLGSDRNGLLWCHLPRIAIAQFVCWFVKNMFSKKTNMTYLSLSLFHSKQYVWNARSFWSCTFCTFGMYDLYNGYKCASRCVLDANATHDDVYFEMLPFDGENGMVVVWLVASYRMDKQIEKCSTSKICET